MNGEVTATIHGERFNVETEGGKVFIVHPKWSLVGQGRNYTEARQDLWREAALIADALRTTPLAEQSPELTKMLLYIHRLLELPS